MRVTKVGHLYPYLMGLFPFYSRILIFPTIIRVKYFMEAAVPIPVVICRSVICVVYVLSF